MFMNYVVECSVVGCRCATNSLIQLQLLFTGLVGVSNEADENMRQQMRAKALAINQRNEHSSYQSSKSSSNDLENTATNVKGLLGAIGDANYPVAVKLLDRMHSVKAFVHRSDLAWRQLAGKLIGKVNLPRVPSPNVQATHSDRRKIVTGLLTNIARLMKFYSQGQGPLITAHHRRPVLLLQVGDSSVHCWIIAKASFRPFFLWGIRLVLDGEVEGGTMAHLQFDQVTNTNFCIPAIDSTTSMTTTILHDMERASVDELTYMLPDYSLDWLQPLQTLVLKTNDSPWIGWDVNSLQDLADDADASDSDSSQDDNGDENENDNNDKKELDKALKFLKTFNAQKPAQKGQLFFYVCADPFHFNTVVVSLRPL